MSIAKGIAIGVGTLGLVGGGYYANKWMMENPVEPEATEREAIVAAVRVIRAEPGSHRVRLRSQGRVDPKRSSRLVAEVAGKVVGVSENFELGGTILKGERILQIDPTDYQNAVSQAKAALTETRTALRLEVARGEQAAADWARLGKGREPGELTLRKPQIAAAEARVASAEAALATAEQALERTEVFAPYDCRVEAKGTEIGSFVGVGQPLVDIFSLREREVVLPFSLENFGFAQRKDGRAFGKAVARSRFGIEDLEWKGKILRGTGRVGERTLSGQLVVGLEENPDAVSIEFKTPAPGTFVHVEVEGRLLENVFAIPREALRPDGSLMLVKDGRLHFRDVTIERTEALTVYVSGGLEAGEQVVVSPMEMPIEGMAVKIESDAAGTEIKD